MRVDPRTDPLTDLYLELDRAAIGASKKHKISCRKGCDACCHMLVALSSVEAERIAQRLWGMSESDRTGILKALSEQAEILASIEKELGEDQEEDIRIAYWQKVIPCAFLDPKTHLCRIYVVRPISCRTYMVKSPAKLCLSRDNVDVSCVTLSKNPKEFSVQVMHRLAYIVNASKQKELLVGVMPDLLLKVVSDVRQQLILSY